MTSAQILYIEDTPMNVYMVSRVCENFKLSLTVAANGEKGLALIYTMRPDLLLLDIMLPDIDGLEVLHRIRSDRDRTISHMKIVALTARAMTGDRERFLAKGCDAYLSKPYRISQLIEILHKMGTLSAPVTHPHA